MSALTTTQPAASAVFSSAQLDVIKRGCAPDTNQTEFDLFIATAGLYGLNPLKREIMAVVYSKDKPDRRRMAIIVEIGGLRTMAARSGNYRPDDEEPEYFYSPELKDPKTNPLGIERCRVKAWTQDSLGEWHKAIGVAYWDEFAALEDEWEYNQQKGKREPTGKKKLGAQWEKMPRHMIAKCAEAVALRKGWPEQLNGVYIPEEAPNSSEELLASQKLEQHETEKRNAMIGARGKQYALQFEMGSEIQLVDAGKVHDKVCEYLRDLETVMEVRDFRARNKLSLRQYWANDPGAALDLNKQFEAREAEIEKLSEQEAGNV
jgi:phage recombination protein Bet